MAPISPLHSTTGFLSSHLYSMVRSASCPNMCSLSPSLCRHERAARRVVPLSDSSSDNAAAGGTDAVRRPAPGILSSLIAASAAAQRNSVGGGSVQRPAGSSHRKRSAAFGDGEEVEKTDGDSVSPQTAGKDGDDRRRGARQHHQNQPSDSQILIQPIDDEGYDPAEVAFNA